jgi:hypothetical protein
VAQAQQRYPNLAGIEHDHHITPKYLGGPNNGPTTTLDAAYHQMITNEFRGLAPYGKAKPSAEAVRGIMDKVYSRFPLPPGVEY